jgi:ribosomal protein S18 acetylase RimI-like enzyme
METIERIDRDTGFKFVLENINADAVPADVYYVCRSDGHDIGFIGIVHRVFFMSEVKHWYVLESYRSKGIGTKLLSHAVRQFESKFLVSSVRTDNVTAQRLFISNGWVFGGFVVSPYSERNVCVFYRMIGV